MPKDFVPYSASFRYLLIISLGVWAQRHLSSSVARIEWMHVFCLGIIGMFWWTLWRGIFGSSPSRRYAFAPTLPI